MRISDWSSDVCSSDLHRFRVRRADRHLDAHRIDRLPEDVGDAERIVPECVAQRPHRRLGAVAAAYVGAHADLQNHALPRHPACSPSSICGTMIARPQPNATTRRSPAGLVMIWMLMPSIYNALQTAVSNRQPSAQRAKLPGGGPGRGAGPT